MDATRWVAEPASAAQQRELVGRLMAATAAEYRGVMAEAQTLALAEESARRRALERLRRELRRIGERDHFPPPEREQARAAVEALAFTLEATP